MLCKLADFRTRTYPKREQLLTLEILDTYYADAFDELKDGLVDVSIKRHRKRRSKDANAYAWVLMDKLADALSVKQQRPLRAVDVYREAIREIPGVSDVMPIRNDAVARFRAGWAHNGLGWQSEILGPHVAPGYMDVIVYYGSSSFDTRQMGALLDYLIAEAQELSVPTDTPEQVEKYKYYWAQAEAERRKNAE